MLRARRSSGQFGGQKPTARLSIVADPATCVPQENPVGSFLKRIDSTLRGYNRLHVCTVKVVSGRWRVFWFDDHAH